MKTIRAFFLALVAFAASSPAFALSGPSTDVRSFTFACNTGIQRVQAPTGRKDYNAIWVWVNSATPVYFGDSTVDSTGMPLCTTAASCVRADQSYEVKNLYCLSSSGSVTVNVEVATP